MTFLAPGYHEAVSVPPRYVDNGLLDVPFNGPSEPLDGGVCVQNRGRNPVALYASADRTKSRSTTTVGAALWPSNFDLTFFAARRESLLDDAAGLLRRLRLFHAHLGLGVLWLLTFLVVFLIPVASVAAVAGFTRRAREPAGRRPL